MIEVQVVGELLVRVAWMLLGLYVLLGIGFAVPLVSGDVIDVPPALYLPVVVLLIATWPIGLMILLSAALVIVVAGRN